MPIGSYPSGSAYLTNRRPASYLEDHSSFSDLLEEAQQRRENSYAQGAYFTGHPQDALSERHYNRRKPQSKTTAHEANMFNGNDRIFRNVLMKWNLHYLK